MTVTLNDVNSNNEKKPVPSADEAAAVEFVRMSKEQGLSLTDPDGLLKLFTTNVLEKALNAEMTEHLGHEKSRVLMSVSRRMRIRGTSQGVLTEAAGHLEINVPHDRDGTFTAQIVKKRQRRLSRVDEMVVSLYAKGVTTGKISISKTFMAPACPRRPPAGSSTR